MSQITSGASPKSPRYFYKDQLAAAWMAKEHDIKFVDKNGLGIHPIFDCWSVKWYFDETPAGAASAAYFGEVYYVHPDCLLLLEPILGDLIWTVKDCFYSVQRICDAYDKPQHNTWKLHRITERGGKAFMWPDQEAA